MKLENLKDKFNVNYQTKLDETSYIVAIRDDDEKNDRNLVPIFYFDEKNENWEFLENKTDIRGKVFVRYGKNTSSLPLNEAFDLDELLKLKAVTPNNTHNSENPNSLPFFAFRNQVELLPTDFILEIFSGNLNITNQTFKPENEHVFKLIKKCFSEDEKPFFVQNSEDKKIYGAFFIDFVNDKGNEIFLKKTNLAVSIYELPEDTYLDITTHNLRRKVIKSIRSIQEFKIKNLDFVSKEFLFDWAKDKISPRNPEIFKTTKLLLEELERNEDIKAYPTRFDRLYDLLQTSIQNETYVQNFFDAVEGTSAYKENIEKLEKQKLNFSISKNMLEREIVDFRKEKEELSLKKQALAQDILELSKEQQRKSKEIEEQKINAINTEIKAKESLIEKANFYGDLDKILKDIEFKERVKEELRNSIFELKREFITTQKDANQKLQELIKSKTHFDFISGRNFNKEKEKININPHIFSDNNFGSINNFYKLFSEKIKSSGRNYTEHFIANLMICVHQDMLTVFIGLSGSGKTSLAKKISKILVPEERSIEISVGKAWSSLRDWVGFSNPISDSFHQAQTKMYPLLKQLDAEREKKWFPHSPLSFVTLDEANTSSLEHYWRIFYNLCDSSVNKDSLFYIDLGGKEKVTYTNSLRFIATMNIDRTSEDLSPRMLDRMNIIRLDSEHISSDIVDFERGENLELSLKEAISIFNLKDFYQTPLNPAREDVAFTRREEIKYNRVKNWFKNMNIFISPRVEMSMKNYCTVARKVMKDEFRPLDYCISQRILPKIDLHGDYLEDLINLLEIIESFNLENGVSEKILRQIIKKGSEEIYYKDNFNYFLTTQ